MPFQLSCPRFHARKAGRLSAVDFVVVGLLFVASLMVMVPPVQARVPKDDPGRLRVLVLPAGGYNPDDGVALGAFLGFRRAAPRLQRDEGRGLAPELGLRPYVWDLVIQPMVYLRPVPSGWSLQTTASWFPEPTAQRHLDANLQSYGVPWEWWFGTGNTQRRDLTQRREDDPVSDAWHRFAYYDTRLVVRYRLGLAGPLSFSVAGMFRWSVVNVRPETLLAQQVAAGEVLGAEGGPMGGVEVALVVDTRNEERDPVSGGYAMGQAEFLVSSVGPAGRFTIDLRGYLSPPEAPVVLAGQVLGMLYPGDVPFYELGEVGGPDYRPRTLTGLGGMRGFVRGKLRGPLGLLVRGEVRLRPPGFAIGQLDIRLQPVFYLDAVRTDLFGSLGQGPPLHPGFGGGIRLVLEEQIIVRVDMGTAPDLVLSEVGESVAWPFALYAAVNHTF